MEPLEELAESYQTCEILGPRLGRPSNKVNSGAVTLFSMTACVTPTPRLGIGRSRYSGYKASTDASNTVEASRERRHTRRAGLILWDPRHSALRFGSSPHDI